MTSRTEIARKASPTQPYQRAAGRRSGSTVQSSSQSAELFSLSVAGLQIGVHSAAAENHVKHDGRRRRPSFGRRPASTDGLREPCVHEIGARTRLGTCCRPSSVSFFAPDQEVAYLRAIRWPRRRRQCGDEAGLARMARWSISGA